MYFKNKIKMNKLKENPRKKLLKKNNQLLQVKEEL